MTAGPTLYSLLSSHQAPCSAAAPGGPCLVPGACPGLRIPVRCVGHTPVSPFLPQFHCCLTPQTNTQDETPPSREALRGSIILFRDIKSEPP